MILLSAAGRRGWEAFRIGYVAGMAHYLVMLTWLLHIPYRWHGIPLGPAAGWAALSAFLALFPATWVWALTSNLSAPPAELGDGSYGGTRLQQALSGLAGRNWVQRTKWALYGAVLWVALEMLLARIFGGFPWDLLGVSQYRLVPLIQIASVTGVYGVSFLVIWFSLSLASGVAVAISGKYSKSTWVKEVFLPALVVAVLFNLGFRHVRAAPEPTRRLKVATIQPSIPQTLIWDSQADDERIREVIALSERALSNHVDLLIWPESAVPKLLRYDEKTFAAVTGLARRFKTWMIIGADDAEPKAQGKTPDDTDYFNSSFLISPEGRLVERYRKRSLVIFGEYIPLVKWLPFVKWFTPIQGGFTPGDKSVDFKMDSIGVTTSVLICYEDVFAHVGRSAAQDDEDFLVNITNNGWFGEAGAQWQHAVTAIFRAVENGLPLVRATNSGLSCWIDAQGRLRDFFTDPRGSIYGKGIFSFELPLSTSAARTERTFYNRHGDVFGWSCAVLAILGLLMNTVSGRKMRRQPQPAVSSRAPVP